MARRAPAHYAVSDAASTGTLSGGWRGEHRHAQLWMAWQAPAHEAVEGAASTGTLSGEWRGDHRHIMR